MKNSYPPLQQPGDPTRKLRVAEARVAKGLGTFVIATEDIYEVSPVRIGVWAKVSGSIKVLVRKGELLKFSSDSDAYVNAEGKIKIFARSDLFPYLEPLEGLTALLFKEDNS